MTVTTSPNLDLRAACTVSVIVPTRNAASRLENCLLSVRAQSWPDIELVVVDNHSSDETVAIARRHADEVITAGPERSAQRNIGSEAAHGDVLVFVDADMVLERNVVAEAVDVLQADPNIGMVVLPELAVAEGVFGRARELEKRLYLGDERVEAARVFRREAFEAVGGFDLSRNSFEDWDLADRVRDNGVAQGRTTSVVWHHEGKVSLRRRYRTKRYYGAQSAGYVRRSVGRRIGRPLRIWRASLLRPWLFMRHPVRAVALALLKTVELAGVLRGAYAAGAEPTRAPLDGARPVTPMRILHVISAFAPQEGMGRVIHEIAARTPGEHHVLCARAAPAAAALATVTALGGNPVWYLLTRRRAVRRALATARPDVVHFHGGTFTPFFARLRIFRSLPKVVSIYNWPRLPRLRELRRARPRSLITSQVLSPRVFASALVPTGWVRRAVASSDVIGLLTPDRAIAKRLALPHKVDYAIGGAGRDERRARFNLADPVVVFAGRAENVRGLEVLIAAMRLVRVDVPNARLRLLLLARPDLKRFIRRLDDARLTDAVDLTVGPVAELRNEFAAATVAAFPFLFDHVTFTPTLTVAEAMSVGLPVVGTPVECLSAIVRPGMNGLLVPVGDASALADAITTLLTDEHRWTAMSDGAVNTVRQTFDWSGVVHAASQRYEAATRPADIDRRPDQVKRPLVPKVEPDRIEEIDRHFEKRADAYANRAFSGAGLGVVSARELAAVRSALAELPKGSDVLDVGVGSGRISRLLAAELGMHVTGIDPVLGMLEATRKVVPGIAVAMARLGEPLPFADGVFDAAVAIRVLKWVPRWASGLSELARIVRPGGYAVFEVTNARSLAAFGYRRAPVTRLNAGEVVLSAAGAGLVVTDRWPGTRLPHPLWAWASTPRRAAVLSAIEHVLDVTIASAGARSVVFVARKTPVRDRS